MMTAALAAVAQIGALAAAVAFGVLWERHRHPPPPSTHRVILSVDRPPDRPE